jgi:hypothetical protein
MSNTSPSPLPAPNCDSREEKVRNSYLISSLRELSGLKVRSFKVINELVPLLKQQPFFQEFANNFRLLSEIAQKI